MIEMGKLRALASLIRLKLTSVGLEESCAMISLNLGAHIALASSGLARRGDN